MARNGRFLATPTLTAGQKFTVSVVYRQIGAVSVPFQFDYWDGGSVDTFSPVFNPTTSEQTAAWTFTAYASPVAPAIGISGVNIVTAGNLELYGLKLEAGNAFSSYVDTSLENTTYTPSTNLLSSQDFTTMNHTGPFVVVSTTATGELIGSTGTTVTFGSTRTGYELAQTLTVGQQLTFSVRYLQSGTTSAPFQINFWDGANTDMPSITFNPSSTWQVATHTVTVPSTFVAATGGFALVNNAPQTAGNVTFYGLKMEAGGIATAYVDPSLPAPQTSTIPAQPATVPAPISGLGLTMVFGDDFTSNPLTNGVWTNGNWKIATIGPATNIKWDGVSAIDIQADAVNNNVCLTNSGISSFKSGYFEFRAKWSGDPAQSVTIALLPDQHNNYNNTGTLTDCVPFGTAPNKANIWGEWDVAKWCPNLYGTNTLVTQATQHFAQTGGQCVATNPESVDQPATNSGTQIFQQAVGHGNKVTITGIDTTQYHTYGLLWTTGSPSGTLKWYIDGVLATQVVLSTDLTFPTGIPYQTSIESQSYFVALQNATSGTLASAPSHLTIDYAQAWAKVIAAPVASNISAVDTVSSVVTIPASVTGVYTQLLVVTQPTSGSVTTTATGFSYTAGATAGTVTFTWQAVNQGVASNTATCTITVSSVTTQANVVFDCSTYNTSSWSVPAGAITISATLVADPNATVDAQQVQFTGTARTVIQQSLTGLAAGSYSASVYTRATSGTATPLYLGYYNGTTPISTTNNNVGSQIVPTTSWVRASTTTTGSLTFTVAAGDTPNIVIANTNSDTGTGTIGTTAIWGLKVESGSTVTAFNGCAIPPAPVASNASVSVQPSTTTAISASVSGSYTSLVVNTQPSSGSVTVNGTTGFNYTSTATLSTFTFTWHAVGAGGSSNIATETVTVATVVAGAVSYFIGSQPDSGSIIPLINRNMDCAIAAAAFNDGVGSAMVNGGSRIGQMVVNYAVIPLGGTGGNDDPAAAARGDYDSEYLNAAKTLNGYQTKVSSVRIGVEVNGNWFAGSFGSGNAEGATPTQFSQYFARFSNQIHSQTNIPVVFNLNYDLSQNADVAWPGDAYVDILSNDFYDNGSAFASGTALWNNFLSGGSTNFNWMDNFSKAGYTSTALINGPRNKALLMAFDEWGIGQGSGDAAGAVVIQQFNAWINARGSRIAYHCYWDSDAAFRGTLSNYPLSAAAYKTAWQNTHYAGTWAKVSSGTVTVS